jgi:TetR/AcrR family transcriptional regulator
MSVREVQRSRLLRAAREVVAEDGYTGMSVERVRARAGVSRSTFDQQFSDREDCFLALLEESVERIAGVVVPLYEGPDGWPTRLRAALEALLEFLDAEPDIGRVLLMDGLAVGPRVCSYRHQVLAGVQMAVDEGRECSADGSELPPMVAEAVVGGVLEVIRARLFHRPPERLRGLVSPLVSLIVTPYLGPTAAAEELERETPKRRRRRPTGPSAELDSRAPERPLTRITYRTLSVLVAISLHPGASSREIAKATGNIDEGQMSKLLARLQNRGLIVSTGRRDAGEPHAWQLTELGEEVRRGSSLDVSPSRGKSGARNVRSAKSR